jgi:hypothetical protein
VKRWIAKPARLLAYTGMPALFEWDPTKLKGQEHFPGTGEEQLEAVVDLLMNYDWYLKERPAPGLIPPTPTAVETTETAADGASDDPVAVDGDDAPRGITEES